MAAYSLSFLSLVVCLTFCQCQQQPQPQSIDGQVEQELCPNFMHEYRLAKDVVPINYNLKLQPNLVSEKYTGEVTIKVGVLNPTHKITVHINEVNITESAYYNAEGEMAEEKNKIYMGKTQTVTIQYAQLLDLGQGELFLKFEGVHNHNLKGFYRTTYKKEDGTEVKMVATHFEPSEARRMFPCFDEPDLKATFDITVTIPDDPTLAVLSNMPESGRTPSSTPNAVDVSFEQTPQMSTYLLAITVGEMDHVEGRTSSGTQVRVFTPKNKGSHGIFAKDYAIRCIEFYNNFFGLPYPLPKSDQISIPDFAMGAMENWGLILYREAFLLINKDSTLDAKRGTMTIVAHELAHQWFGNLVTMYWWSDIWLNEGFAEFMMYYTVKQLNPDEPMWEFYVRDEYFVMHNDAMQNSHPVIANIKDPVRALDAFDEITYKKGSIQIRVLHDWLGDATFRKALQSYMKKHQYGNTCTNNLWRSLGETSGLPVKRVMDTWLTQIGFPLINVEIIQQNGNSMVLDLSQTKFEGNSSLLNDNALWNIPLFYVTKSRGRSKNILMYTKTKQITVSQSQDDYFLLNPEHVGFYRVNYPDEILQMLQRPIQTQELTILNRAMIQEDLAALARAGYISAKRFFDFIPNYINEDNYFVWKSVSDSFSDMEKALKNRQELIPLINEFGRKFYTTIYSKLTWDLPPNHKPQDLLIRSLVFAKLSVYECPKVRAEARQRFKDHHSGVKQVPVNMKRAVFAIYAQNVTDAEYDEIVQMYIKATNAGDKGLYSGMLVSTSQPKQITKLLNLALSDNVRTHETPGLVIGVAQTPMGRRITWNFFKQNKQEFKKRYGNDKMAGDLLFGILNGFASEEMVQDVERFMSSFYFPGSEGKLKLALEAIRARALFLRRQSNIIVECYKSFLQPDQQQQQQQQPIDYIN